MAALWSPSKSGASRQSSRGAGSGRYHPPTFGPIRPEPRKAAIIRDDVVLDDALDDLWQ